MVPKYARQVKGALSQAGIPGPPAYPSWMVIHQPAYTSSHRIVALETSLYSGASDELLWSARTETWDAKSENRMMREVIDTVVAKLKADGLLEE